MFALRAQRVRACKRRAARMSDDAGWSTASKKERKKRNADGPDASQAAERPAHHRVMLQLHTKMCEAHKQNRCRKGLACTDAHTPEQLRRSPYRKPEDMFPNVYCGNKCKDLPDCDRGDRCWYTHTDGELMYHPAHYKIKRCSLRTLEDGSCERNGPYCSFAHGEDDLRRARLAVTSQLASATQVASDAQASRRTNDGSAAGARNGEGVVAVCQSVIKASE